MKNQQNHRLRGSIFLLLFIILGYTIKFYPSQVEHLDSGIQQIVREDLPKQLGPLFRTITFFGNPSTFFVILIIIALFFYVVKKWKTEALFLIGTSVLCGLLVLVTKYIYVRTRPSIEHLVVAKGYSFPSGHSTGSMMIYGFLMIVCHQRIKSKPLRLFSDAFFALLILLIGLSRIYAGVHYPTDVIGGFLLGFACLNFIYPFYAKKRFISRFKGNQK